MADKIDSIDSPAKGPESILPERPKHAPKTKQAPREGKPPREPRPPRASAPVKKGKTGPGTPSASIDPDSIFKEGFLADVYREKPTETVITRFPPEPNGYLHIGHSKAIAINFGFARHHGGECYLRYDDTNPEAEEEKYFVSIREMIEWLGFTPVALTYSSDNFDQLYELAEKLIAKDGAYVCHCSATEVNLQRGGPDRRGRRFACAHRTRPVAESMTEFRAMRDGKYRPQEAFLRMKQSYEDGNPQMWDLTAYRVLEASHHRTGDKWKIYPTYDFTHCLCDSIEKISHSLCTTEFINSRQSYDWLCDELEVYKPMQREYGRLNMEGTLLSKRKIARLVAEGRVKGWDDPRLYTLVGLRRRGIPPGAILAFVNELGASTAVSKIQVARFENCVRKYLESSVPRLMLVLDPILVIITNLSDQHIEEVDLPFSTKDPTFGTHTVPFTNRIYIDRSDFKEEDSKDYFRLAPGKTVGLFKVPFPIRATGFTKDPTTGLVTEVEATYEEPAEGETMKKPKAYIQWVADCPSLHSPVRAEVRVLHPLILDRDGGSITKDDILLDPPKNDPPTQPTLCTSTAASVSAPSHTPPPTTTIDPIPATPSAKPDPVSKATPDPASKPTSKPASKPVSSKASPPPTTTVQILNPTSLTTYPNAVLETGFHEIRKRAPWPAKEGEKKQEKKKDTSDNDNDVDGVVRPETVRFQGMRVGYFAVDRDGWPAAEGGDGGGKLVLNRIVSLKEDAGKV